MAAGADRHVRPQVVRDRADRALHAAGLDLRAGLDDALQEPHRRRAGGVARDVRLLAARLAGLRPGAGDDHPGAALRAVHHPALRQRAPALRQPARGFGAHPRRRAADGDAAGHPAADAAGADVGDGADLRQVPRRVRRALRARPAGRLRHAGDLALPEHRLAAVGRRRGAGRRDHADRGPHPDHRRVPDARGAAVRDHRLEGLDGPAEPARPLALGRDRVRGADVRALASGCRC